MNRLHLALEKATCLYKQLSSDFYYHNYHHAMDVCKAVMKLADMEGIRGRDRELLETAALYHDVGYTVCYESNEKEAVKIVQKDLPEMGYDQDEIKIICSIISATAMPQNPSNKLEELICDADLDNLGREDFLIRTDGIRKERNVFLEPVDKKNMVFPDH